MGVREHHDLILAVQVVAVQAGQVILRPVQQCEVSTTVADHRSPFAEAEGEVDRDGAGGSRIAVQDGPQQVVVTAGFECEDKARGGCGCPPGTAYRRGHRAKRVAPLGQEHLAGRGEANLATGAFQQGDAHPAFEQADRAGQRRLRDTEPVGGPSEMQFLGDRDEVAQFPSLDVHTVRVSIETRPILGCGALQWSYRHMTDDATIALVTGANKGIGRAVAGQLAELGITVLIGARDREKGALAADEIRAAGGESYPMGLDVTDQRGVTAAAEEIDGRFGRLDILINNAGIAGDLAAQAPGSARLDGMRAVFEANLFGVVTVTEAMLPLLRRSPAARIVNVSSGTSSMTWTTDATHYMSRLPGALGYPVSKAALNMLTVQYAKALSRDGILVNAAAPGACDTDFAAGLPFKLTRTAADGAAIVLRLATLGRECPTGGFFDDNSKVPW